MSSVSAAETGLLDRYHRGSMLKTGVDVELINLHADVPSLLKGNSNITRFPWHGRGEVALPVNS